MESAYTSSEMKTHFPSTLIFVSLLFLLSNKDLWGNGVWATNHSKAWAAIMTTGVTIHSFTWEVNQWVQRICLSPQMEKVECIWYSVRNFYYFQTRASDYKFPLRVTSLLTYLQQKEQAKNNKHYSLPLIYKWYFDVNCSWKRIWNQV